MALAAAEIVPHRGPSAPALRATRSTAADAVDAPQAALVPSERAASSEPIETSAAVAVTRSGAADPAVAVIPRAATAERLRASGRYLAALVQGVAGGNAPEVTVEGDEVVLTLADGIGFSSGESEPSGPARSVLAELRAIAVSMPDTAIAISGHTDDRPIRTARFPSNLELSLARAAAVAAELAGGDAELTRRIFASGYADRRPRASNRDDEGRAQNRRVEIRLLALG
jgi:flagellar motor protein MotB